MRTRTDAYDVAMLLVVVFPPHANSPYRAWDTTPEHCGLYFRLRRAPHSMPPRRRLFIFNGSQRMRRGSADRARPSPLAPVVSQFRKKGPAHALEKFEGIWFTIFVVSLVCLNECFAVRQTIGRRGERWTGSVRKLRSTRRRQQA